MKKYFAHSPQLPSHATTAHIRASLASIDSRLIFRITTLPGKVRCWVEGPAGFGSKSEAEAHAVKSAQALLSSFMGASLPLADSIVYIRLPGVAQVAWRDCARQARQSLADWIRTRVEQEKSA